MNINLGSYVVRGAAGIDMEATLEKFAGDLATWEAQREAEASTVAGAVHAVFDASPGTALTKKWIVNQAVRSLNATPDTWGTLEKRVEDYLKTSGQFSAEVGRGGGFTRLADK